MSQCVSCGAPLPPGSAFCEKCGKPVVATPSPAPVSPQPAPAYQPPPAIPAPARSSGGSGCLMGSMLGVGCLLVLAVILIAIVAGAYYYKDEIEQYVESLEQGAAQSSPASPASSGNPSTSSPSAPASSHRPTSNVVKVSLGWDQPVDMDLEIWDEQGQNLVTRSFKHCGSDVTSGSQGQEYFEFSRFGSDNFTSGKFVVSVFFADQQGSGIEQSTATVTVRKADGSAVTRRKTIDYQSGRDQWHAFSINASTGEIRDLDRFINIQTRPNN